MLFPLTVTLVTASWIAAGNDGAVAAPPVPSPATATSGAYRLRPAADGSGTLIYESKAFVARIAVDGLVAFRDNRVSDFTFMPPWLPVRVANGMPSLQDTIVSLLQRRRAPVPEPTTTVDESFLIIPNVSRFRPDPREGCRNCDIRPSLLPLNAMGTYDVTEDLMLFSGQDPHRLEKARFLAATREMRVRMALAAQTKWRRAAAADLPGALTTLACDRGRARGERRRILEALRDEMAKTADGEQAAGTITAFIASFDRTRDGEGCPAPDAAR
jgi:hypothetical protein